MRSIIVRLLVLFIAFYNQIIYAQYIFSTPDVADRVIVAPDQILLKLGYRVSAQAGTFYRAYINPPINFDPPASTPLPPSVQDPVPVASGAFADTKGTFSVTSMGGASYSFSFALPAGIQKIGPQLSLSYDSSSDNGMAGYGWNLNGISSISMVASSLETDGNIRGIRFDGQDRFALDGQRLLLKSGEYGKSGAVYETENYSNLLIESIGSTAYAGIAGSRPEYFKVTFPDGVQVYYGLSEDSRGVTEWMIKKWIDPQGNYIEYFYDRDQNTTYLRKIVWGGNEKEPSGYVNSILLHYKKRTRTEFGYIGGVKLVNSRILDRVEVYSGDKLFKKYQLSHEQIKSNYQRLTSIQEFNTLGEVASPVVFNYSNSRGGFASYEYKQSDVLYELKNNNIRTTADFDGDGQLDVITNANKIYFNLFGSLGASSTVLNVGKEHLFDTPIITNFGGKLSNKQSLLTVIPENYSNNYPSHDLRFKIYTYNGSGFSTQEHIVKNPYSAYTYYQCQSQTHYYPSSLYYILTGDFNGDGVSEVLFENKLESRRHVKGRARDPRPRAMPIDGEPYPSGGCYEIQYVSESKLFYIDLNSSNIVSKEISYSPIIIKDLNTTNYIGDFSGSGKDEILAIKTGGVYSVYSLNSKTQEFEVVFSGKIQGYSARNILLTGDLNGDGKIDFMFPEANKSSVWHAYLSTGKGFEYIRYDDFNVNYEPFWSGPPSRNRRIQRTYQLVDLNKDGKSDFVVSEYESWTESPGNRNGRGNIYYYENVGFLENLGRLSFLKLSESQISSRYGYNDPINLFIADYKQNQKTGNFAFVQGNEIWRGEFFPDLRKDILLKEVKESSEKIITQIEYSPLEPNGANGGLGDVNGVYFSSNSERYPYREIERLPNMDVVSKVSVRSPGNVVLTQYYKYYGLTAHLRGLGILGFKKTARTNWIPNQTIPHNVVWNVEEIYPQLGKTTLGISPWISSYSFVGNRFDLIVQPQDNQLLTKKSVRFFQSLAKDRIQFYRLAEEESQDFITGIKSTSKYEYDTYGNLSKSVLGNGVSTTTTHYTYSNNPQGKGIDYYIGRIVSKNNLVQAYGDTYSSKESYTYQGNLVSTLQKQGYNTETITESYTYDVYGNLITQSLSGPNMPTRTVQSRYDLSGRFVVEKTDAAGLKESFTYTRFGQPLSHKDALGVTTLNKYDGWGKLIEKEVSGGSAEPIKSFISYSRTSEGGSLTITETPQTGEYSQVETDIFSREIKNRTKGFSSNSYISKQTLYDALGRKIRESEPYLESVGPNMWTQIEYDALSRPVKQSLPTGKQIITEYNGLSVTVKDGVKSQTLTKDAQGNTIRLLDNGETLTYTYYAHGGLKSTNYKGHSVTLGYDGWGRKIRLLDPTVSNTPYTYQYNLYGELIEEKTPEGVTRYSYDALGRLINQEVTGTHTDIKKQYKYSTLGLVLEESGSSQGKAYQYNYTYDSYHRLTIGKETSLGGIFETRYTYDALGRKLRESRKVQTRQNQISEVVTESKYNSYNGIQDQLVEVGSGKTLWQITSMNERMQLVSSRLGNGVTINNTIDGYGFVTKILHQGGVSSPLSLSYSFDIRRGTLQSRTNHYYNWKEDFTYDSFDRLTRWTDPRGSFSNSYEADGRIKENSEVGFYNYQPQARYKKSFIDLNQQGLNYYTQRSKQQITYNTYKNPVDIIDVNNKIHFEYNINGGRSSSETYQSGSLIRTKYYSSGIDTEIVEENGETKVVHYLSGSPYDAPVIYVSIFNKSNQQGKHSYYYLHRDYQGSIMAISDEGGRVIERRVFTPWGEVARVTDAQGNTQTENAQFSFLDRGYTGHEHLFSVGLIHMNGRLYDPVLKQFLSPDNYIQEPYNSQNYNRYGYVLNNPLMYTDPSGEIIITFGAAVLISTIVAATTYTAYALYTDTFSWGGFAKSIVIGAASGVAAYGIGGLAGTMFPSIADKTAGIGIKLAHAAVSAGMHSVSQGFIQGITGGDIMQGMASGLLSSLASSAVEIGGGALHIDGETTVGSLFFGTVSGGFGSVLTGGNFWEGAAIGLYVSLLNHVAHSEGNGKGKGKGKDNNGGKERDTRHQKNSPKEPPVEGAKRVPRKGGERWVDKDGKIYEWDRLHGDWEVYNKNGRHQGSMRHGETRTYKDPVPGRRIDKIIEIGAKTTIMGAALKLLDHILIRVSPIFMTPIIVSPYEPYTPGIDIH